MLCWATASQAACDPAGDVQFICGLDNAEDLYHIDGTPWVVASSALNDATSTGGGLLLIHTENKTSRAVDITFPENDSNLSRAYAKCPSKPREDRFDAHGINLRKKRDGLHELYVVNHSGRESIEVLTVDTTKAVPTVSWIGCIVAPEHSSLNSVAPLPDGGLAVTNIVDPTDPTTGEKLIAGQKTGYVLEWFPDAGWRRLPGSELSGNNGIEASPDGQWLYVAGWGDGTLTRLSRTQTHVERRTVDLKFLADNVRWGPDGTLLVAGQNGKVEDLFACFATPDAICTLGYTIAKLDPDTLEIMETISRPGTDVFGAATGAIQVDDELWVGTFRGNRVARIAVP